MNKADKIVLVTSIEPLEELHTHIALLERQGYAYEIIKRHTRKVPTGAFIVRDVLPDDPKEIIVPYSRVTNRRIDCKAANHAS